ncbi:hypothetical protein BBJ28_00020325 [Nothophytophthora sp. Chile5]|nr:hypothetical protein BBJ28_00020325 [Nothophytophthora sp. Chile5]
MSGEFERWFADPIALKVHANGEVEPVLSFWKRQHDTNNYHFLPAAVRVAFTMPVSSAQIQRDFRVSGMDVTTQRMRLKTENIDMCSFLNRSRNLDDITQCPRLTKAEAKEKFPQNTTINLNPLSPSEMFDNAWESLNSISFTSHVTNKM